MTIGRATSVPPLTAQPWPGMRQSRGNRPWVPASAALHLAVLLAALWWAGRHPPEPEQLPPPSFDIVFEGGQPESALAEPPPGLEAPPAPPVPPSPEVAPPPQAPPAPDMPAAVEPAPPPAPDIPAPVEPAPPPAPDAPPAPAVTAIPPPPPPPPAVALPPTPAVPPVAAIPPAPPVPSPAVPPATVAAPPTPATPAAPEVAPLPPVLAEPDPARPTPDAPRQAAPPPRPEPPPEAPAAPRPPLPELAAPAPPTAPEPRERPTPPEALPEPPPPAPPPPVAALPAPRPAPAPAPPRQQTARPPSQQQEAARAFPPGSVFMPGGLNLQQARPAPAAPPAGRPEAGGIDLRVDPRLLEGRATSDPSVRVTGANVGADWRAAFRRWLDQNIRYPRRAIELREMGAVRVIVTASPDGRVRDIRLVGPSASPSLNTATTFPFSGAQLPAFPPPADPNGVTIELTVNYILIMRR